MQEGHSLLTSGAQGQCRCNSRCLAVDPAKLTVILPQSLEQQSPESQELLEQVLHLVSKPENDELPLTEASTLCNRNVGRCDQLICFAFHDSETLIQTCQDAEDLGKVVTLLFFDRDLEELFPAVVLANLCNGLIDKFELRELFWIPFR